MKQLYCGLDLHSTNTYVGIMDEQHERIFEKRVPNELAVILQRLKPFQRYLKGIAVESTYNWYWLVDGLQSVGYAVHLAHPPEMDKYDGHKCQDDRHSAFWLAKLLAMGVLPEGYIYPKEDRPVRDLCRKRLFLVRRRTAHILSLKNMLERNTGKRIPAEGFKHFSNEDFELLLKNDHLVLAAIADCESIVFLNNQIKMIEKPLKTLCKLREPFHYLLTITGIGDILAMTIMLETGPINRFASFRKFCSYARCVPAKKSSNKKMKKKGANRKNGNAYLSWAFAEAGVYARMYSKRIKKYYQKKLSKTNVAIASKAVAHKMAKASYIVVHDRIPYNEEILFR